MRKAQVELGQCYAVEIEGRLVRVRISQECEYGGWYGLNLRTKKVMRVKTAARLRFACKSRGPLKPSERP